MTPFGDRAGYAGALYSLMQLGGGAVISSIATFLPDKNPVAIGLTICFCGICAWLRIASVITSFFCIKSEHHLATIEVSKKLDGQ